MKVIKMNRILVFLSVLLCSGLPGCYQFVAEHPEKSKQAFYEDKSGCEKKARAFAQERRVEVTDVDEINHARRCMRDLGWEYHFRRTSASSDGQKAEKAE